MTKVITSLLYRRSKTEEARNRADAAEAKLEKVADLVREENDFSFEMIHSVGYEEDTAFEKGVIAVQSAVRRVLEEGK